MRCIYCPIHSENSPKKVKPKVLSLDFAKCGIDDYFGNSFFKKGEKKGIRIFSNGEAMLEFKRVKEIIDYAHNKSSNNLFFMCKILTEHYRKRLEVTLASYTE